MTNHFTRRKFLQTGATVGAAVAGAGYWSSVQAEDSKSPNEKIRFACVGVGGKGGSDSDDAAKHGDIVAICDVDDKTADSKAKKKEFEKAKKFYDFRKMFDELGKSIDAVTVSTPDHCHAVVAAMAMKMGKHCFCQKPLTHTIYEARTLGKIAKENKVATQMGNQGTAGSALREAAAVVQSGALGTVKEVHVWTNRPIWPQGGDRAKPEDPPANLHWDEWLGPAPQRPYAKGYHPFAWRGWWDFGTGALGDMACHTFNMPFMALMLRDPTSVHAKSSGHNKDSYPKWSEIEYEFPANDKRPAVKVTWYDGGQKPKAELFGGEKIEGSGALIIGDKGKLYSPGDYAGGNYKCLGFEKPKVDFEKSPGHFEEFVRAIKGGPQARSNFPDYAGPLTETILLGNLAVWATGKKVEWDAKNMVPKNAPECEVIVRNEYRKGYTL